MENFRGFGGAQSYPSRTKDIDDVDFSTGSVGLGVRTGLAAFEPSFADELAVIMEWAFDYLQRDGEGHRDERTWLRDETGGSVYLRLTTKPLEQPLTRVNDELSTRRHRWRLLVA